MCPILEKELIGDYGDYSITITVITEMTINLKHITLTKFVINKDNVNIVFSSPNVISGTFSGVEADITAQYATS